MGAQDLDSNSAWHCPNDPQHRTGWNRTKPRRTKDVDVEPNAGANSDSDNQSATPSTGAYESNSEIDFTEESEDEGDRQPRV